MNSNPSCALNMRFVEDVLGLYLCVLILNHVLYLSSQSQRGGLIRLLQVFAEPEMIGRP
jgi:hypothetical protein